MNVKIDMTFLLYASFGVIGVIEWVKSILVALKAKDGTWKWPVLALLSAALVAAFSTTSLNQGVMNFFLLLAFNEILGYNVIVRLMFAVVDGLVSMLSPRFSPPSYSTTGYSGPTMKDTVVADKAVTKEVVAPPAPSPSPTSNPGLSVGNVPPPPQVHPVGPTVTVSTSQTAPVDLAPPSGPSAPTL